MKPRVGAALPGFMQNAPAFCRAAGEMAAGQSAGKEEQRWQAQDCFFLRKPLEEMQSYGRQKQIGRQGLLFCVEGQ